MEGEKSCEFCEHCLYIGAGDFWCDELQTIVSSDWDIGLSPACDKYEERDA